MNLFINSKGNVRVLWWMVLFFSILSLFTVPLILISANYKVEITLAHQAIIIIVTNLLCQKISKRSITELIGKPDFYFLETFLIGSLIGAGLMIFPAMIMYVGGWVQWDAVPVDYSQLAMAAILILTGAIAEEFLFRGFLFQRLLNGIGVWPAQLIVAGLFLLTHLNNPGMTGITQVLATINIFIASLLFGFAYLKTKNLAMPIGLHFMANLTQGTILGFNVSGEHGSSLFKPTVQGPDWISGGSFGIEASIWGLLILICLTFSLMLYYSSK